MKRRTSLLGCVAATMAFGLSAAIAQTFDPETPSPSRRQNPGGQPGQPSALTPSPGQGSTQPPQANGIQNQGTPQRTQQPGHRQGNLDQTNLPDIPGFGGQAGPGSEVDCSSLARLRDESLYPLWFDAVARLQRARVFYDARLELRRMRDQLANALPYANAVQGAGYIAQVTKTSADLIIDGVRAAGADKAPGVGAVVRSYADLRRAIGGETKSRLTTVAEKAVPQVAAAAEGIKNLTNNTQILMKMANEGSLGGELHQRLVQMDKLLAQYDNEVKTAFKDYRYVIETKNRIDQQCGRQQAGVPWTQVPQRPAQSPAVGPGAVPAPVTVTGPVDPGTRMPQLPLVAVEHKITNWRDPLTPPQSKADMRSIEREVDDPTRCTPVIRLDYQALKCEKKRVRVEVPDTIRWRHMECTLFANTVAPVMENTLRTAVDQTLQAANLKPLITQLPEALKAVTQGKAAIDQWTSVFAETLKKQLVAMGTAQQSVDQALKIQTRQSCGWGQWS